MRVGVSEAKGQLLDLVRRAEAGEEVILTRNGADTVRLARVTAQPEAGERRRMLTEMLGVARASTGPCAARSQDFLYGDDGLPR